MRQNISSAVIAVIITFITFFFLEWSYNDTDELKNSEKEFICTKIDCGDENIEVPKVDQDFIDDIRGALEDEPDIKTESNKQFVMSLNSCIDYVYISVSEDYQLPKELIVAQAILESAITKTPVISTNVGIADEILSQESIFDMDNYHLSTPNVEFAYKNAQKFTMQNQYKKFVKIFEELII